VAVDDDDDHGQVLGQGQDPRGVDPAGGAESFDAVQDRGSGQARFVGTVDDLGEQWLVVPVA